MSIYPCQRNTLGPRNRREFLAQSLGGFGAIALSAIAGRDAVADSVDDSRNKSPYLARPTHFAPKAKRVVVLYMDGGVSQVDSFDPKPLLTRENGKPFAMKIEPTQFNNNGATLGSPWKFENFGESGIPVSELFPNMARHVDRFVVIRSMTSEFPEHTNANYFLHTGTGVQGRPSMGAWVGYGLGTECSDLPAFLVLNGGLIPPGGLDNFQSGFLPATYQASVIQSSDPPIANLERLEPTDSLQRRKLDLMRKLDRTLIERIGPSDAVETAIANYELACRMQVAVPEMTNLNRETAETRQLYGLDSTFQGTAIFARQCLLARRLLERGVRFIELTCPNVGHDRWDQHSNLKKGHEDNARAVDQPIGALLTDLARRGMLEDTLVVFTGEFGRTPFAQGTDGRDHNPFAFSLWMAGAGIRGGTVYGETDEFGYKVVDKKVEIHDLHATMLHLMGMDHTRLTYRFGGRDMRLTDVKGRVIREWLA